MTLDTVFLGIIAAEGAVIAVKMLTTGDGSGTSDTTKPGKPK